MKAVFLITSSDSKKGGYEGSFHSSSKFSVDLKNFKFKEFKTKQTFKKTLSGIDLVVTGPHEGWPFVFPRENLGFWSVRALKPV